MHKTLKILIVALAVIAISLSAHMSYAQSARAIEQIKDFNRIKPLQNPDFEKADDILDRRLLDSKNRVVGEISDVIVNANGTISSIVTEFDRLRLGTELFLNYRSLGIQPRSDSYALRIDADEIEAFYPTLLAETQAASGVEDETMSLNKLIGAPLVSTNGRKVGKVKNILFNDNGSIIRAAYIELSTGLQRGETIAIPFRNIDFSMDGNRPKGTLEEDFIDAMIAFVQ